MIISVFIPHGGCPERCTFCDQKVSGGEPVSNNQITQTIDAHLETYKNSSKKKRTSKIEIAFYGGTFTALSHTLQIRYLENVRPYLESKKIDAVRIATRPDAIDADWILHLKNKYQLETIELGVQSFNPHVLKNLGRSHSNQQVFTAVNTLKQLGIKVGVHIMIGCPGESEPSLEDWHTLENLLNLAPEMVRIHPLLVIEGTELSKSKEFTPISIESAVKRAAFLTKVLENKGIKVIRLGLQSNDLLSQKVVGGPYDPGFGDRVRTLISKNSIESSF